MALNLRNLRNLRPVRSLVHPLWLGALALLVLNDHGLKGSGMLPGWLTGKLSDFAGLLVAPAVLAVLLRASSRRGVAAAHLAVGAGFSAIKLFPTVARAVEALTASTPFPWRITVDPTDLIALPVLVVSYVVLGAAMARPTRAHPAAQRLALIAGSVACMATSKGDPCLEGGQCNTSPPLPGGELASLTLGNTTEAPQIVRLRRLKDTVEVDCAVLLDDPTAALSRELFGPAETWLLDPGRALPLQNTGCDAYLIDADGLPMTLLAWSATDFPNQSLSTSTANPVADTLISLQREGARLRLAKHPAVFTAPLAERPAPPAACGADEGSRLDWTEAPRGSDVITRVTSSPDGCHALELAGGGSFYLCVPSEAMPFKADDRIEVSAFDLAQGSYPELPQGAAVAGQGIAIQSATHALVALRANVLARWSMTDRAGSPADFSASGDAVAACASFQDACGSLVEPLEVSLLGEGVPEIVSLRPGQSAALAPAQGTLYLTRAEDLPIRDTGCFTGSPEARVFESVLVADLAAP